MSNLFPTLDGDPFAADDAMGRLASLISSAYTHDQATIAANAANMLGVVGAVTETHFGIAPEDSWWTIESPPELVIVDSGTETLATLLTQASTNTQTPFGAGAMNSFNAARVTLFGPLLTAHISAIQASHPGVYSRIIFAGHSLGGADGVAMQAWLRVHPVAGLPPSILVTFGAPRISSTSLAIDIDASSPIKHLRVHNELDPVPQVPPTLWPISVNIKTWQHSGTGILLKPDGKLLSNPSDPAFAPALIATVLASPYLLPPELLTAHAISSYVNRLRRVPEVASPEPPAVPFFGGSSMPVTLQATTFFKCDPAATPGWTETFYLRDADSIEHGLQGLILSAVKRAACLGNNNNNTYISKVRVSNVSILGDSLESTYLINNPKFNGNAALGASDMPSTSILLRVEGTSLYRRSWFFSGLPDDVIQDGGQVQYLPSNPLFWANVNAWKGFMTSGQIPVLLPTPGLGGIPCMRVREKNPLSIRIINDVTLSVPGAEARVFTTVPHGFIAGDRIIIKGINWAPDPVPVFGFDNNGPRGVYYVASAPAPDTISFTLKADPPKLGVFSGSYISEGTVKKQNLIYQAFTGIFAEEGRTKKRGQPSGRPRGHSKVKMPA